MLIQVAHTWGELEDRRTDWNRLSRDVPFRRCEWAEAWWRHYGPGHQLLAISVVDPATGRLVGLAPWYIEKSTTAGRVIRFLGSGEVCSEYPSLLTEPGYEHAVIEAIVAWLINTGTERESRHVADEWDLMELTGVNAEDNIMQGLTRSMSAHDCVVHARPGLSCWRILLPPTWEAYLSMLSKPTRRRVRWAEKKLRDTKNCSVKVVRNEAELESAWRVLVDLHQRRRGSLGQAGCFSSDRFGCFLKEVASRLLSSGDLHMAWVEVQGRPIAAGLNLRGGKVTYAYQVGIDPDALEQNPGWLVNTAAIRQAIEEGHHGFDLLRGDEPYKGHLRAEPRAVHEIRIVPDRLRSQLLHTAWRTGTTVKDWLKTGLALTGMR